LKKKSWGAGTTWCLSLSFKTNSRLPTQRVPRRTWLRSRDGIVVVNDQEITSPEQAVEFFQRLAEGGDITIKLKRRRRSRQIKLNIE
jgi:PDZ domain-containing secreted protein